MNNNSSSYERYQRQVILKEFGEAGQQKLLDAKVLLIGAGGLGCPALQYLAATGAGTIGIIDDDVVVVSNLHRQVLFSTNDIGLSKAERAKDVLQKLNPGINIIAYNKRLTTENALNMIAAYEIIIDGTDNFATRYMINDACVLLGKPLVYGAISQFEGQVAIFNYVQSNGTASVNYRDLFPQPPKDGEVQNCAEAGVLGVLPGIIGTMMANETIKLITGIGQPLINRLLTYNTLNNQLYVMTIPARAETRLLIPENETSFLQTNYDWLCSNASRFEIDAVLFNQMLNDESVEIIDVREQGEIPVITEFTHERISMTKLGERMDSIKSDTVILFCQSGKRSLQAAQLLFDRVGTSKKIYSLKNGITNWKK